MIDDVCYLSVCLPHCLCLAFDVGCGLFFFSVSMSRPQVGIMDLWIRFILLLLSVCLFQCHTRHRHGGFDGLIGGILLACSLGQGIPNTYTGWVDGFHCAQYSIAQYNTWKGGSFDNFLSIYLFIYVRDEIKKKQDGMKNRGMVLRPSRIWLNPIRKGFDLSSCLVCMFLPNCANSFLF